MTQANLFFGTNCLTRTLMKSDDTNLGVVLDVDVLLVVSTWNHEISIKKRLLMHNVLKFGAGNKSKSF